MESRLDRGARALARRVTRRGAARTAAGGVLTAVLSRRAGASTAKAQEATPGACPATTQAENKALVERYWREVWTAGGEDAVSGVLAPDEVHHWGIGDDTVGHEAFRGRLRQFLEAFPDFATEVEQLVAEGDRVVSRQTYRATHRGEWLGIAPTETEVEWTGVQIFRIECGRIAESWGQADHLGLLRQLGGLPGVATPAAATPTA